MKSCVQLATMTTTLLLLLLVHVVIATSAKSYPIWPFDFKWSVAEKLNESEYTCIHIIEPDQPLLSFWYDNYLCYNKTDSLMDPGLKWSYMNSIPGMKCTKVWEPSDSVDWHDNYLCVPQDSPYDFKYSYSGCFKDLDCLSVNEPSDLDNWFDNYLCHNRTGRFEEKYDMDPACSYYNGNDFRLYGSVLSVMFASLVALIYTS